MCSKEVPASSPAFTKAFNFAIEAFVDGEIIVLETRTTFPFLAAISFNFSLISASTIDQEATLFPFLAPAKRAESYNGRIDAII